MFSYAIILLSLCFCGIIAVAIGIWRLNSKMVRCNECGLLTRKRYNLAKIKKETCFLRNPDRNVTYEVNFDNCDVDGCENEGCSGGTVWRESGYWTACRKHSNDFYSKRPQPRMKQSAIDRENSRDKITGYLP
jgi:hypothetical protein